MKISELGERGLVRLIASLVEEAQENRPDVAIGIGDDAAAWRPGGPLGLVTADSLLEGVHFSPGTVSWGDLGWKALAVNLSDIAAMGGFARYAVVCLGLRPETQVEEVTEFYRGMLECAREYGVAVIGGDTDQSPFVFVTVTALGDSGDTLMTRDAARPGDRIAVTGTLGSSAAGLRLLSGRTVASEEAAARLRRAHLRPRPRLAEGQALVRLGVRCAIDVSDGLAGDLAQICRASRADARIHAGRVPVDSAVHEAAGDDALDLALAGGEDYELLFTASEDVMARVCRQLRVAVIGEMVAGGAGEVVVLDANGQPMAWKHPGWEHFTSSPAGRRS